MGTFTMKAKIGEVEEVGKKAFFYKHPFPTTDRKRTRFFDHNVGKLPYEAVTLERKEGKLNVKVTYRGELAGEAIATGYTRQEMPWYFPQTGTQNYQALTLDLVTKNGREFELGLFKRVDRDEEVWNENLDSMEKFLKGEEVEQPVFEVTTRRKRNQIVV